MYAQNGEGEWIAQRCVADGMALCPDPSDINCVVLGEEFDLDAEEAVGLCDLVPGAFFALADLDLDGDTETFEGISAGLRFRAQPGTISGVAGR